MCGLHHQVLISRDLPEASTSSTSSTHGASKPTMPWVLTATWHWLTLWEVELPVFLGMGNFPNNGDFGGLVGKKISWGIPIQNVGNFVFGTFCSKLCYKLCISLLKPYKCVILVLWLLVYYVNWTLDEIMWSYSLRKFTLFFQNWQNCHNFIARTKIFVNKNAIKATFPQNGENFLE